MKRVAIVFTQAPHGSASGREGLDALFAISALTDEIAAVFISDGVCQLLSRQRPEQIVARNYITSFKLLQLYDINDVYLCNEDFILRGGSQLLDLLIPTTLLSAVELRTKLQKFDVVLTF